MGRIRFLLAGCALVLTASGCSVRAEPAPVTAEPVHERVYSSNPLGFLEELAGAERQSYHDFASEFRRRLRDDSLSAVILGEFHGVCNVSNYTENLVGIIQEERAISAFYDEAALAPFARPGDPEIGVYQQEPCPSDVSSLPYRTFKFGWSDPTELDEIAEAAEEGFIVTYTGSSHTSPLYMRNSLGIASHGMDSLTPPRHHGDSADSWPTVQETLERYGVRNLVVNVNPLDYLMIAATEGTMRLFWEGQDVAGFPERFDALLRGMETDTAYRIGNEYVILTWQLSDDVHPLAERLKDAVARLQSMDPEQLGALRAAGCGFRELIVYKENSNIDYNLDFDAGPGIIHMGGWQILDNEATSPTCSVTFYDDGSVSVRLP